MRTNYLKVDIDTTYLDFEVQGAENVRLKICRAGNEMNFIEVLPLYQKGCSVRFHIKEPCFGLLDGWYYAYVESECDTCVSLPLKITNKCSGEFVEKHQAAFSIEDCETTGK